MHRLRGNILGDDGTVIICKALCESKNSKLQDLDLAFNDVGFPGAEALAALLAVHGELTALNVQYNSLGDEGQGVLRQAVKGRSGFDLKI